MEKVNLGKRMMIDKANKSLVITVSLAAFVAIFSLVAAKTLFSQAQYQNKVITKKRAAVTQLRENVRTSKDLKTAYDAFVGTTQNVIGGSPVGTGEKDGDNAKIVLDALPSRYDFPALATSLDKILSNSENRLKINNISGNDDALSQSQNLSSVDPVPVAMPFEISVTGDYTATQNLIKLFESSIRPFQIKKLTVTASGANELNLSVNAETFYQPAKSLQTRTEVVQ